MRKIILASSLLFSSSVFGNTSSQKFKLSTNPLSFIFGYDISGEYAVTEQIVLGSTYVVLDTTLSGVKATGSSFGVNLRYFLDNFYSDGWYFNASAESGSVEVSNSSTKVDGDYTAIILLGGYQWAWKSVYINLGFGVANYNGDYKIKYGRYDIDNIPFDGIKPQGELDIGFMF